MPDRLQLGWPPVEVRLRRSARARRLTLRYSRLDGSATLTMPLAITPREAENFVARNLGWLEAQARAAPPVVQARVGARIPFRGKTCDIIGGAERIGFRDGAFHVCDDRAGAQIKAFLKTRARSQLAEATDVLAARIGRRVARLTLRDTRSRWGSCTAEGALMFSWRLVMAPPAVLEYVAAHEVAHMLEMNHSARFWQVVEDLCPGYRQQRAWLRKEGPALHRISFDS